MAELAWQLSRYLRRSSVNFKINSRPLFTIIYFKFKNDNFKTQDFSLLIEGVLSGVNGLYQQYLSRTAIQAHLAAIYCPVLVCPQKRHHVKLNFILYRINSQSISSNSYWAPIIFKLSAKSIYSLSFTGDRTYSQLLKTGFLSLPHFFSY